MSSEISDDPTDRMESDRAPSTPTPSSAVDHGASPSSPLGNGGLMPAAFAATPDSNARPKRKSTPKRNGASSKAASRPAQANVPLRMPSTFTPDQVVHLARFMRDLSQRTGVPMGEIEAAFADTIREPQTTAALHEAARVEAAQPDRALLQRVVRQIFEAINGTRGKLSTAQKRFAIRAMKFFDSVDPRSADALEGFAKMFTGSGKTVCIALVAYGLLLVEPPDCVKKLPPLDQLAADATDSVVIPVDEYVFRVKPQFENVAYPRSIVLVSSESARNNLRKNLELGVDPDSSDETKTSAVAKTVARLYVGIEEADARALAVRVACLAERPDLSAISCLVASYQELRNERRVEENFASFARECVDCIIDEADYGYGRTAAADAEQFKDVRLSFQNSNRMLFSATDVRTGDQINQNSLFFEYSYSEALRDKRSKLLQVHVLLLGGLTIYEDNGEKVSTPIESHFARLVWNETFMKIVLREGLAQFLKFRKDTKVPFLGTVIAPTWRGERNGGRIGVELLQLYLDEIIQAEGLVCPIRHRPLKVGVLCAGMSPDARQQVMDKYEKLELDFVVQHSIFQRATDIPLLAFTLNLQRFTEKSYSPFVQQVIGRVARDVHESNFPPEFNEELKADILDRLRALKAANNGLLPAMIFEHSLNAQPTHYGLYGHFVEEQGLLNSSDETLKRATEALLKPVEHMSNQNIDIQLASDGEEDDVQAFDPDGLFHCIYFDAIALVLREADQPLSIKEIFKAAMQHKEASQNLNRLANQMPSSKNAKVFHPSERGMKFAFQGYCRTNEHRAQQIGILPLKFPGQTTRYYHKTNAKEFAEAGLLDAPSASSVPVASTNQPTAVTVLSEPLSAVDTTGLESDLDDGAELNDSEPDQPVPDLDAPQNARHDAASNLLATTNERVDTSSDDTSFEQLHTISNIEDESSRTEGDDWFSPHQSLFSAGESADDDGALRVDVSQDEPTTPTPHDSFVEMDEAEPAVLDPGSNAVNSPATIDDDLDAENRRKDELRKQKRRERDQRRKERKAAEAWAKMAEEQRREARHFIAGSAIHTTTLKPADMHLGTGMSKDGPRPALTSVAMHLDGRRLDDDVVIKQDELHKPINCPECEFVCLDAGSLKFHASTSHGHSSIMRKRIGDRFMFQTPIVSQPEAAENSEWTNQFEKELIQRVNERQGRLSMDGPPTATRFFNVPAVLACRYLRGLKVSRNVQATFHPVRAADEIAKRDDQEAIVRQTLPDYRFRLNVVFRKKANAQDQQTDGLQHRKVSQVTDSDFVNVNVLNRGQADIKSDWFIDANIVDHPSGTARLGQQEHEGDDWFDHDDGVPKSPTRLKTAPVLLVIYRMEAITESGAKLVEDPLICFLASFPDNSKTKSVAKGKSRASKQKKRVLEPEETDDNGPAAGPTKKSRKVKK